MKGEIWREVIDAIEAAIPDYDLVNEKVSFGLAMKTREYAVDQLALKNGVLVLDAGIGPGTMSEALLSRTAGVTILGLDASTKLLLAARERFKSSHNEQVHFVRAVFEAVPVKDASVGGIVSAYAFRDSRDRSTAIDEFHRVIESGGCFAIVDLGKPDNPIKRILVTIYIQYLMPLIAHFRSRIVSAVIPGV